MTESLTEIEAVRKDYKEKFGKDVANSKKNDLDWINSKLECPEPVPEVETEPEPKKDGTVTKKGADGKVKLDKNGKERRFKKVHGRFVEVN